MNDYIVYEHIDSSLITIDDLLDPSNLISVINVGQISKIELLAYNNNLNNLYNEYTVTDKKKYLNDYNEDKAVIIEFNNSIKSIKDKNKKNSLISTYNSKIKLSQLNVGTLFEVPLYAIRQENIITLSNQSVKQTSFQKFYINELFYLYTDPKYRKIEEDLDGDLGKVKDYFPDVTVWIWCRTLNKVLNVTPFIRNISTNNTETGGNWNLSLVAIKSKYIDDNWEMDGITFIESSRGLEYTNDVSFTEDTKSYPYFFEAVLQENDIIFIRFETLKNEVSQRITSSKVFEIPLSEISKGQFDMIGLIDNVVVSSNPSNLDVNITVSGRDLIKLLIEDGTYFFALEQIEGGIFVKNEDIQDNVNRVDGKLFQLSANAIKTIDYSLKFIINALSHIRICDDYIFNSYSNAKEVSSLFPLNIQSKDIRSKVYDLVLKGDNDSSFEIKEVLAKGIWQIVNLVIDKNVQNFRLVDQTIGNEMGSVLNAVNKVCQKPFVEFFSDTYRNKFYFICRRPPFDKDNYLSLAEIALSIKSSDLINIQLQFGNNQIYSWYKLQPQGALDELGEQSVWAYLKAIKFKEYTEVFGDKCLMQICNYMFYNSVVGEKDILNINHITREYIYQLKYLIECNQYIPFVRSGQIVINGGDRRIKRGTVIYLEATGEYCYVDQVAQSFSISENSIDRTTTLNVSRCMVKDYIDYYFKIINTDISNQLFSTINVSLEEFTQKYMNNWRVNKEIFDFFLKRKQFSRTLPTLKMKESVLKSNVNKKLK